MPFRKKYISCHMSLPLSSFRYYRLINLRKSTREYFCVQFAYKLSDISVNKKDSLKIINLLIKVFP